VIATVGVFEVALVILAVAVTLNRGLRQARLIAEL
jgi:hypothetical protein